jgi:drug/metabolite transporter (DMT)-like permease
VWFGLAAALCQGVGMVLASNGLKGVIEPMSAQTVRMSAGAVGIVVIAAAVSRRTLAAATPSAGGGHRRSGGWTPLVIGTFTGPLLGVWCSLFALQKLEVGVATTLMSLVPVMILPFAKLTEGRWPSARAVLGAVVAVSGVAILATSSGADRM